MIFRFSNAFSTNRCVRLARVEMVRVVLDLNIVPVDSKTALGETPFHYAAESGRHEIAVMLLQAGAYAHARDARGLAANHYAAR